MLNYRISDSTLVADLKRNGYTVKLIKRYKSGENLYAATIDLPQKGQATTLAPGIVVAWHFADDSGAPSLARVGDTSDQNVRTLKEIEEAQ